MNFDDFARGHGLILKHVVPGKWMAVPTEDHPRKRNGRYKFLGDVGWVQNWATMSKPEMWRSEGTKVPTIDFRRIQRDADRERLENARKAAQKAAWIMHQCKPDTHPYLERKGFPDEKGNVWENEGRRLLVVPMRNDGRLIGCQLIDEDGGKKFLAGQQTKGASFVLDAKGIALFCEGYATALSIRAAMKAMKVRYTIHVCFSAGNVKCVAGSTPNGVIIADRDPSGIGELAAKDTGKPYWLSETVGEDFNDYQLRVGLFQSTLTLKKFLFADANAQASA